MQCPDCKGKKTIQLFTTVETCGRCAGTGEIHPTPASAFDITVATCDESIQAGDALVWGRDGKVRKWKGNRAAGDVRKNVAQTEPNPFTPWWEWDEYSVAWEGNQKSWTGTRCGQKVCFQFVRDFVTGRWHSLPTMHEASQEEVTIFGLL